MKEEATAVISCRQHIQQVRPMDNPHPTHGCRQCRCFYTGSQ